MERICYQTSRNIIWFWLAWASLAGLVVKNMPASVGGLRDMDSIPWWKDFLEEKVSTHSNILTWRIPWTEEPGGLSFIGWQWAGHDWVSESKPEAPLENHIPTLIPIEKAALFPHVWVSKFLSLKPLF